MLLALSLMLASAAHADEKKPVILAPLGGPFMGVGISPSRAKPSSCSPQPKAGLHVDIVYPDLPGWKAGLRPGDVIDSLDGKSFHDVPDAEIVQKFLDEMNHKTIGKAITLKVSRNCKPVTARPVPIKRIFDIGTTMIPSDSEIHPGWEKTPAPPIESYARKLAREQGIAKDAEDTLARIADLTQVGDPFRLGEIAFVQRHPFRIAEEARAELKRAESGPLAWLGGEALPPLKTGLSPQQHLEQLRATVEEANRLWAEAFAALSAKEIDFLYGQMDPLLEAASSQGKFLEGDDLRRVGDLLKAVDLAAKVRLEPLYAAARSLLRIADRAYVEGLYNDFKRAVPDLTQPVLARLETPFGDILIGGTGDNRYDLSARPVAVLIDLGGNDIYSGRAGATNRTLHASIVVDREGNDRYESSSDFAQGAGLFGVGILADLGGDDVYVGQRGSQGFSFLGVGLLLDSAGNDRYYAKVAAQGCAFWGKAALLDQGGNDRYEAQLLAQGVGIAGGRGALVDAGGDDFYRATGAFPSSYGTEGTFNGLSQGVGYGIRGIVAGGIGILDDLGGRDRFEAGDFSQGGGYYFGWGILNAGGKEDRVFVGSRYSQGFAAHQALGTFFGGEGNDVYGSLEGVSTGVAMDLSVSWFEERGGNDRYQTRDFTVGSSAHNALSVFIDRGGKDLYEGTHPPATASGNDYHGGTSLSLVMDLGGGDLPGAKPVLKKDDYTFLINAPGSLEELTHD